LYIICIFNTFLSVFSFFFSAGNDEEEGLAAVKKIQELNQGKGKILAKLNVFGGPGAFS